MLKGKYVKYQTDSGIFDLRDSHTQLNVGFTELTFIGRATARNTSNTNNVEIDVSSVASNGDLTIICAVIDERSDNASAEMELVDASDDSTLSGGVLLAGSFSDTDPNNDGNKPHMAFFHWTYDGATTPKVLFNNSSNANTATALVFRGTVNSVSIGSSSCISRGSISAAKDSATVPSATTRLKVGFQCDRINGTIINVDLSSNLTGQTGYTFYDGDNQPDSSDTMDDAYLILGPNDTDADVTLSNDDDRNITAAFASLNVT